MRRTYVRHFSAGHVVKVEEAEHQSLNGKALGIQVQPVATDPLAGEQETEQPTS